MTYWDRLFRRDIRGCAGGSRVGRRAFTLVELVIVIGIIFLLAAITLSFVARVQDSAKRVVELSNLQQLVGACSAYAQNNDGFLPVGRAPASPPGHDDYTWMGFDSCWQVLLSISPSLVKMNSCTSVHDSYPGSDQFGLEGTGYYGYGQTRLGWIYWGGRDDLMLNGQLQYRSQRHLGQHLTPGSRTLWTCLCWDSAGNGSGSLCPHIGSRCVTYPNGVALKPPPDGLNVALDDGSASFVAWTDLITIQQANGYKLYYQP